jgi:glycosyltransferase involved in cell wall biosynthesis
LILYVLRYWPTRTETFAHAEIAAISGVELATFGAREGAGEPEPVPVHHAPHGRGWWAALPALVAEWLRRPAFVPARVLWLTTQVRRARHVHVHFAGEAAAWTRLACRRAGVHYSVTVHAVDLWKPRSDLPVLLRDAATVVTISETNAATLRTMGVDPVLVRCGVDPALPADGSVVLTVARNVPKKGLDVVIEAARRRPALRFVLVSDIADPGLPNVTVTGLLPHRDVLAWVQRARVVLQPCRIAPDGDRDGVPVVLLEALAASVPVITTPVSGIPEIVDEVVGWLVPPDDVDAVVAALDAPEAELRRRGAAGPGRVAARGCTRGAQIAGMRAILGV